MKGGEKIGPQLDMEMMHVESRHSFEEEEEEEEEPRRRPNAVLV